MSTGDPVCSVCGRQGIFTRDGIGPNICPNCNGYKDFPGGPIEIVRHKLNGLEDQLVGDMTLTPNTELKHMVKRIESAWEEVCKIFRLSIKAVEENKKLKEELAQEKSANILSLGQAKIKHEQLQEVLAQRDEARREVCESKERTVESLGSRPEDTTYYKQPSKEAYSVLRGWSYLYEVKK